MLLPLEASPTWLLAGLLLGTVVVLGLLLRALRRTAGTAVASTDHHEAHHHRAHHVLGHHHATVEVPEPPTTAPDQGTPPLFTAESVLLDVVAADRDEAIRLAGGLLVARGAAGDDYVEAMLEREQTVSTYMGSGLAIPHGTPEAKDQLCFSAASFLRLAEPVDWNGREVRFVVGIAARNRQHLQVLGRMARIFADPTTVQRLEAAATPEEVVEVVLSQPGPRQAPSGTSAGRASLVQAAQHLEEG